ncbi:MAG: prolipoprotein diacylglyceryl transferase [Thermoflexales bacterium]|nr:prolipoprotein diacylglyceryl transferase [Thermoflexales bacterium]
MLPLHFTFGPFSLSSYTALLVAAALVVALVTWRQTRCAASAWGVLGVSMAAWLSGRIGFLVLHLEALREGQVPFGYAEHAAVLGAWIAHQALRRWCQRCVPSETTFAFAVCALGAALSLSCISHGCAFGREVFWQVEGEHSLAWRLHVDWPDDTLTHAPRLPTQAFMAIWLGVGAALALIIRAPAALGVMWFALGDFGVQFLRGDEATQWLGLRSYQWFDLVLVLSAAFALARCRFKAARAGL